MQTPTAPNLFRRPGAYIPLLMSLAASLILAVHLVWFGTARAADEGPTAHLFQLLIGGQAPIVALFAFTWLRRMPGRALRVLGVQLLAIAAALVPVAVLGL